MQESVLKAFPKADINVSIVWIDMLPSDNEQAAARKAKMFTDPRVRQFYDARGVHHAGKAFAHGLIREGAGPAWDIYMFYQKGVLWSDDLPAPADWMHQLGGGRRADAARFHPGEELVRELRVAMNKLVNARD